MIESSHDRICVHFHRRGYFMEKLQTDDSCIIHDVCWIYSMFWGQKLGVMAKEIYTRLESGGLYWQTTKDVLWQPARSILCSQQQVK
jgi:hypothetical protein